MPFSSTSPRVGTPMRTASPSYFTIRLLVSVAAALCVVCWASDPAVAGGSATIKVGGNRGNPTSIKIEWLDSHDARFSMPGAPAGIYTLLRHGKLYVVANGRVMPMSMMSSFYRSMGGPEGQEPAGKPSLVGPKGRETVAGVTGQQFVVHWSDASGHTPPGDRAIQDKTVVLSRDARVVQLFKVWSSYAHAAGSGFEPANPKKNWKVMSKLFGGRGLLKMDGDFRVERINARTPPQSDFALPARSMAGPGMKGLMGMFRQ